MSARLRAGRYQTPGSSFRAMGRVMLGHRVNSSGMPPCHVGWRGPDRTTTAGRGLPSVVRIPRADSGAMPIKRGVGRGGMLDGPWSDCDVELAVRSSIALRLGEVPRETRTGPLFRRMWKTGCESPAKTTSSIPRIARAERHERLVTDVAAPTQRDTGRRPLGLKVFGRRMFSHSGPVDLTISGQRSTYPLAGSALARD